jgi:putative ubiquitin-RnfH superfamily antitoxin RatB of RatAB toxin-antitoxin module
MDAESEYSEIRIEVAYATPEKQAILTLFVPPGTTVAGGIGLSAIRDEFPDLEIDSGRVGIFSRKVPMDHVLRDGDRIEIYRPLIADPKEVRRRKAEQEKG